MTAARERSERDPMEAQQLAEALAAARRDAADHERAWATLRRLLGLPETPHDHGRDVLEALDTMQRARDEARRALEAVRAIVAGHERYFGPDGLLLLVESALGRPAPDGEPR